MIQRNTKEEVVQELLPKVHFPPPASSAASESAAAAAATRASTAAAVKMPQRVYIAEKGGVFGSNEAVLQQMQDTLNALMAETQELRKQIASADQEIAQLSSTVQEAQDAVMLTFKHQQQ